MVILPLSALWRLICSILWGEHHVARTKASVHEITWYLHERTSHTHVVVHHGSTWSTLHHWVWLTLRRHTSWGLLLLSVVLLLLAAFDKVLLRWLTLRSAETGHLLHHHGVHTWHLGSHSHVLLLRWIGRVAAALMLGAWWAHWSLRHHLSRLLLGSARLWLRLL